MLLLPLLAGFLFLSACAHHRDVRPGPSGVHQVLFKVDEEGNGGREAMSQANHFCEQYGKQAVVLNEHTKYTGNMSESTYKTTKTAGKVATAVGGMAHIFGGEKERNAGGLVALGGIGANAMTSDGYSYKMRFRCSRM